MNNGIQVRAILTGTRASVFWGWDLEGENRRFLEAIDPGFFGFVARTCAQQLEEGSGLERADRLRAGMNLRLTYGQASETLMALLAAMSQAPIFPLGWMLRYKVIELEEVVTAIDRGRSFAHLMVHDPVTWESLASFVYSHVPEVSERLGLVSKFADFWSRTARSFLSDSARHEYNSLKHGFRVMPGGFSVAFGLEKAPGQPARPEEMQSLGGSEFGSSLTIPVPIAGAEKHHLSLMHRSRNWSYQTLVYDLQLIEVSISSVVSCLRFFAGTDPTTLRFSWPRDVNDFERYLSYLPPVETMSTGDRIGVTDIDPAVTKDVRAMYAKAKAGPTRNPQTRNSSQPVIPDPDERDDGPADQEG